MADDRNTLVVERVTLTEVGELTLANSPAYRQFYNTEFLVEDYDDVWLHRSTGCTFMYDEVEVLGDITDGDFG